MYSLLCLLVLILDSIAISSVLGGYGTRGHKTLWVVLIVLFPGLGVALYYLIGRSRLDIPI